MSGFTYCTEAGQCQGPLTVLRLANVRVHLLYRDCPMSGSTYYTEAEQCQGPLTVLRLTSVKVH